MSQIIKPKLYLCGGLQSSGSTYISWCFLQRQDMNGYFDANNDILNDIPFNIGSPFTWYKTTLSCFRLSEFVAYYEENGWNVVPLLVIRDCRQVWNSLVRKKYGRDGTTAEDPPLRMRFRRFKEDWEFFRKKEWPILHFENFLKTPEKLLKETCEALGLPWDTSMITWPKKPDEILDARHGSRTFKINRTQGLVISQKSPKSLTQNILPGDLLWLETEFAEYNKINNYLEHDESCMMPEKEASSRSIPQFKVTRRSSWKLRRKPFRWLTARLLGRNL